MQVAQIIVNSTIAADDSPSPVWLGETACGIRFGSMDNRFGE
jgi:hypothetical protein